MTENLIRLLGRYSEGLRLAAEHGRSSSVVFEYAYQNTPQGNGVLGRWIDRTFLGLRTWNGFRQRVQTTKELVGELVAQRRAAGLTTMILDVASGTSPYLRELARERGGADMLIACHDRDPRQVMHGRQLVAAERPPSVFTFSVGDATDESSYLTSRDPDIVLAVGLFPHLQCDDEVRTVIRLVFSHLAPGGCFVCSTLTAAPGGVAHWECGRFAAPPVVRSADTVTLWMRAAGFANVEQRFSQPEGAAVLGRKPAEPRAASA